MVGMGLKFCPVYPFLDLSIILISLIPILIFKKDLFFKIYSSIIISIVSFIFVLNLTYYRASSTIFYLGLLNFMGEAKEVFDISYLSFPLILLTLFLIGNHIALVIIVPKLVFKKKLDEKHHYFYSIFLSLIILFITILSIALSYKKVYKDNKYLADECHIDSGEVIRNYYTKYLKKNSYQSFGPITFYISEISLKINPYTGYIDYNNENDDPIEDIKEDFTKGTLEENNFTGVLKGYNVFTIMVETGLYDFINEFYTPNLYTLMSEGINFKNNYSKNKTSMSEIIAMTGSYPTEGINYNYESKDKDSIYKLLIEDPYTLPRMLQENGYYTSFFHDGEGLYARDHLIGQFGFDSWKHEYYSTHSYSSPGWDFDGSYEMDSDYIDIVLDSMYKKDMPFYTFYTTLSTHGPYTDYSGKTEVIKKLELFNSLGYIDRFNEHYDETFYKLYGDLNNEIKGYVKYLACAFMNLDEAIGKIISRLKDEGLFEKTIFVIYGDHEAYYSNLSRKLTNASKENDVWQYHTSMIFYNKDLTNKFKEEYNLDSNEKCEVDIFTSPYIIVPTLLDILGIEYESKYYYSDSFFDFKTIYDGLFYSNELSAFFNDLVYSESPGNYSYVKYGVSKESLDLIQNIEISKLLKIVSIDEYYKTWMHYKETE